MTKGQQANPEEWEPWTFDLWFTETISQMMGWKEADAESRSSMLATHQWWDNLEDLYVITLMCTFKTKDTGIIMYGKVF